MAENYRDYKITLDTEILTKRKQITTAEGADFTIEAKQVGVDDPVEVVRFNNTGATSFQGNVTVVGGVSMSSSVVAADGFFVGDVSMGGSLSIEEDEATALEFRTQSNTNSDSGMVWTNFDTNEKTGSIHRDATNSATNPDLVVSTGFDTDHTNLTEAMRFTNAGNVEVANDLTVTGATNFTGDVVLDELDITGSITGESLDLNTTLGVGGNTTLGGTLAVTGASTFTGDVSVNDMDITGTLDVASLDLSGTLGVTGDTTLGGALTVTGVTTLSSDLSLPGTLSVDDALTAGSTLDVTGATTLSSTLGVTGAVDITGNTTVVGTIDATEVLQGGLPITSPPPGVVVDPVTNAWEFNEPITTPAAGVDLGADLTLANADGGILVTDNATGDSSRFVTSSFNASTGQSGTPTYTNITSVAAHDFGTVQSDTITANPSVTEFTSPATDYMVLRIDLYARGAGLNQNTKVRIVDNATGIAIRYAPSKASWDDDSLPGMNFGPDAENRIVFNSDATDTATQFNQGVTPFRLPASTVFRLEVKSDSVSLGGDVTTPWLQYVSGVRTDIEMATRGLNTFSGNQVMNNNLSVGGDITVTGDVTATDAALAGNLGVDGTTVLGGAIDVTGVSTFTGNMGVTGDITATGVIGGTLEVTGASTLTGDVSASGNLTVTGDLTATITNIQDNLVESGTALDKQFYRYDEDNTQFELSYQDGNATDITLDQIRPENNGHNLYTTAAGNSAKTAPRSTEVGMVDHWGVTFRNDGAGIVTLNVYPGYTLTGPSTIPASRSLYIALTGANEYRSWYVDGGATGSAGGDLSGNYPNPDVVALRGNAIIAGTPIEGQGYSWNGTTSQFELNHRHRSIDMRYQGALPNGNYQISLRMSGPGTLVNSTIRSNVGNATGRLVIGSTDVGQGNHTINQLYTTIARTSDNTYVQGDFIYLVLSGSANSFGDMNITLELLE